MRDLVDGIVGHSCAAPTDYFEYMSYVKTNRNLARTSVGAIGALLLSIGATSTASDVFEGDGLDCPPSPSPEMRKDYRLRNSTARLKWQVQDTYNYHLGPALRRMKSGDFSTPVIDDLNFLLARWPNHYQALQALVDYEAGGGRANKYFQVSCYFRRANWFVPDDANIFVLYGVYRQRLGLDEEAEQSWKRALSIDSNSAEAHYNLGLLYFRKKEFATSVEHAHAAYALGYPLLGLKKKLAEEGHWE